jgi:hypothetical protein
MFNYSSPMDRLALMSTAALLLGAMLAPDARGWQQPATPCPCEADGTCRPKGLWGYAQTKWRPWPGDTLGQVSTSVEEAEIRKELQLEPFEKPSITKEGQRGPNITKPPKPKRDEVDATEPAVDNPIDLAAPLPGDDLLEEFDPAALGGQEDFNLEPPVGDPLQPGADLLQPGADLLPPDAEPQPKVDLPGEAVPEVEPLDDFDPFSRLDLPKSAPAPVGRRTSLARPVRDDAPPQLPPSLRKLSRRSMPSQRAVPRDSRYSRPAIAMAR